jgi:membrane protease subunit (stomatin/prohibitin family)
VENLSLPDELQKRLDERISMNMIGDLRQYTQFQAAQSIPIAAANQGGMAGLAAGIGAGVGLGGIVSDAMRGAMGTPTPAAPNSAAVGAGAAAGAAAGDASSGDTKFCTNCGAKLPAPAKFCSSCGAPQG